MRYVITYVNITEEKHYHYVIVILNIGPHLMLDKVGGVTAHLNWH